MPVQISVERTKYDRAPLIMVVKEDGVAKDLSGKTVKIEYITKKTSVMKVIGTDDEATFTSDGTDGKVQYNPPSGGWTKNCSLAVHVLTGGVPERYPAMGEVEVRIGEPGSLDPAE